MMKWIRPSWKATALSAAGILLLGSASYAQNTDAATINSVDVDLDLNTSTNRLEVKMRVNTANPDGWGGIANTTFTIQWPATSPALLGTRTNICPDAFIANPTTLVTAGGFKYRTFNTDGSTLLSDFACDWPANTWHVVTTIPVTGNTGCTQFQIVNNGSGQPNNTNFFLSVGGINKTGTIENTPVNFGTCTVDCNGVIGGPAVPGSPCNDNNACTINDVYTGVAPSCGCAGTFQDSDSDGTCDANDGCPNDPNKIAPGVCGCGVADTDSDSDGTPNCNDGCPNDPNKIAPGVCGCGVADTDSDNDGIADCNDNCPNIAGQIGSPCDDGQVNTTGDVINSNCVCEGSTIPCPDDGNPCTSEVVVAGQCTHPALPDGDGDGTCDLIDGCPNDPNKIAPGICGCGVSDADTDGDATADCNDLCPNDPNKVAPGICGCGVSDVDTDGDATADCNDQCPNDPNKIAPGICGCGVSDVDTDGDATADCNDLCPNDPNKIAPGICGCGVSDVDGDGDGTPNCTDGCPTDPNKIAPGICGCGVADTDTDNDGTADCVDSCPNLAGQVGSPCDDLNNQTIGDVINANCVCVGSTVDCNDNNPCTLDSFNGTICVNTPLPDTDNDGTCDLTDGCPNDANKIAPGVCGCGNPEPGATCDDLNAGTVGDVINANCQCVGTPLGVDCLGVPGGSALPGTSCNDNNPETGADTWSANCECIGLPLDCNGVPGGTATVGSSCNDNDVCTTGDVYDANCNCAGTFQDTDGDGVCNADDNCPNVFGQIGSACNDNNSNTDNDMLNANCQCVGTPIGGCTENLTLTITLDGSPSQTTWTLVDVNEVVVVSGGPYATNQANTTVTENICVNVGCYHLRVSDSGNDGITNGGYVLRDDQNRRIIDASLGSFTSTSELTTGNSPNNRFCVPIGANKLLNNWCDRNNLLFQSPIYCSAQPGATGYQFWIYDPHGSYSRRVTRTTNSLVPSNLVTTPVPTNTYLNVRVRAVGAGSEEFGPACRVRFIPNPPAAAGRELEVVEYSMEPVMSIYPNPNRDGMLTISMEGLAVEEATNVDVDIYDLLGKRVIAERATAAEGMLNHRMDLSGKLGVGMYMVNLTLDGKLYTQRLVMQ